jgi:hypothetical protein
MLDAQPFGVALREIKMAHRLGILGSLQDRVPDNWTKRWPPSADQLAEQYFDLQHLRQQVAIAEAVRRPETSRRVVVVRASISNA